MFFYPSKKSLIFLVCLVGVLSGIGSPLQAQEQATTEAEVAALGVEAEPEQAVPEVLSISFEDLMGMEITVASKKSEKLQDAPGIITVITSKELEAFGGKFLGDVLNRAPSMYFLGADLFTNNIMSIRGQTLNQYDTHTLILINGRPVRDNISGGVNTTMYMGIPIESIDHIEIIRGPGSVLYGSNAFAGVINIVTKKADGQTGGRIAATVGSHSMRSESIQGWFDFGELNGFVNMKNFNEQGPGFGWTDFNGDFGSTHMKTNQSSVIGNLNYKQFSFNAFVTELDPTWIDEWGVGDTRNDVPHYFLDLGFSQPLNENITTNLNITYNRHKIGKIGMPNLATSDAYLYEGNIMGKITEKFTYVIGGLIEVNRFNGFLIAHDTTTSYGMYLQGDYQLWEWLKLIGGAQLNKPDGIPYDISPRAGAVIKMDKNWSAKLLYSNAFRSAFPFETSFNLPGNLIGNPSTTPETIETYEAQLMYERENLSTAFTYYHSVMDGLIARRLTAPGGHEATYFNGGGHTFDGLEWEGKWAFNEEWSVYGSAMYQENENDEGLESAFPEVMAKLGIIYDHQPFTVGVYNSFFDAPPKYPDQWNTPGLAVNPAPKPYNLLSANVSWDLSRQFGQKPGRVVCSVYVDNILDEAIDYPEFARNTINSQPLRGGTSLYGTLAIKF